MDGGTTTITMTPEERTTSDQDGPLDPGLLKIGEFARLAGTNLRTLRYYEEIGLFRPAARSKGGFRFYRETDVHRLNMVHTLQELGLSLEQIRDVMDTRHPEQSHSALLDSVRKALRTQDELLEARMEGLRNQKARIQTALDKLVDCESCGYHPSVSNNFCEPCQVDGKPLPEDLSALF